MMASLKKTVIALCGICDPENSDQDEDDNGEDDDEDDEEDEEEEEEAELLDDGNVEASRLAARVGREKKKMMKSTETKKRQERFCN